MHSLDCHSDIDNIALPSLGHRHGDEVVFPRKVIPYHCPDAVGGNGYIWIEVLQGLEMN